MTIKYSSIFKVHLLSQKKKELFQIQESSPFPVQL